MNNRHDVLHLSHAVWYNNLTMDYTTIFNVIPPPYECTAVVALYKAYDIVDNVHKCNNRVGCHGVKEVLK